MTDLQKLILKLDHECQYCLIVIRLDYNNSAWKSVSVIVNLISQLLAVVHKECGEDKALEVAKEFGLILPEVIKAQSNRDLCCIADTLESRLLPFIKHISLGIPETDRTVYTVGDISFEKNDAGEPVMFCDNGKSCVYLTGKTHPYMDALQYFYEYRDPTKTYYAVAGGCMIYEALAIMRIQIDTKVYVIEENKKLVKLLEELFDLNEYMADGRISFVSDSVLRELGKFIKEQTLLVKPASIISTNSDDLQYAYGHYRMIQLSHKEEGYLLYKHYHDNCVESKWRHVSEIGYIFAGKRVYLVAGGPSLGKCFDVLRNRDLKKSVILCVGTSAGKLLKEGIEPEFVIISDPLPAMKKQLSQPFDYTRTALIYACTAYSGAVAGFEGKKYVAFQKDFDMAEEAARQHKLPLYETGGSVSTLALDILLVEGASEVVCLGLDLAYTGNQMHVTGVDDINIVENHETMCEVKSVAGGTVPTVQNLNSKWIEQRLKRYNGTARLINLSDGAYIEGMENIETDKRNSHE